MEEQFRFLHTARWQHAYLPQGDCEEFTVFGSEFTILEAHSFRGVQRFVI